MSIARLLTCAMFLSSSGPLLAADAPAKPATPPAATAPLPGHSLHGEAFNEGPRQKAYFMSGMSAVHFPVTTKRPEAQQFFDQGVAQLHGFWYFEAERSFRQVATFDPDCAMAYWGMAMANVNNEKRAKGFIEKAVAKKAGATPRESAWIDALSASRAGADDTDHRRKYIRDLEALVQDDPNDVEAKAFLALQIWTNGSWMTDRKKQLPIPSHQAVDAILDQIFALRPMHPAHHYRIHLWDDEKPARALVSASLCGQTSPGIAHLWHMPGHTYSKLHRYRDAAWQQEASARVDHAHMMRDGVMPDQIHNYAHNNEWLIRDLAFLGRAHDAIDLATNMIDLPRHPRFNTVDKGSASFGRTRLIDVLTQYELWPELIRYSGTPYFKPLKGSDDSLERSRLLGIAYFGVGKPDEGRKQIAALEERLKAKRAERYKAADEAEAKARKENKSDKDTHQAMADALATHSGEIEDIEQALSELKGYAALAAKDQALAKSEFEKVKDSGSIRRDHLARAFLLSGDNTQAESLARKAVEKSPGEVYPLAVLVEVLRGVGKKDEAKASFEQLRPLAADADLDLSAFERLKPFAEELHLPADWRGLRQSAADVGQRPDLASLGPFRWQPAPATSWALKASDGAPVSLERYRGKPVVLIFYLGSGCIHCVEQLQKFAPLSAEYAAAGISLVAISSESSDLLQASLTKLTSAQEIPFPLAADPELNVFKAYRAFDDFEQMALHGTFLIDGEGLIRWQDISYEPFLDARFVLDEAKRLLGR